VLLGGSLISASESDHCPQINIQELSHPLHQQGVVGREDSEVVACNVVEAAAGYVELHVHAGAFPSLVQFPDHTNWSQEWVFGIVRTAEKTNISSAHKN
jgi:hypothetical protein